MPIIIEIANKMKLTWLSFMKRKLSSIEIKQGVSFHMSDVKGFDQLKSSMYEIENRIILCNTLENYPLSRDVQVVSVSNI